MTKTYQRIVLASRPRGAVTLDNFRLETVDLPDLESGQVLVRNHFLSLDPYMRGRLDDAKSYAPPQKLGEAIVGRAAGVVEASENPLFAVGDTVVGMSGWQEVGVSDGRGMQKVDTRRIPLSAYLGAVGMPGVTAWYGINKVIYPKPGQTVVVSAASGAVGSVAGQLAKLKGCLVVGIAGGREECDYVVNELGFDACIDYKAANNRQDLSEMLEEATPDGVDAYLENVGGPILDAVLPRMNAFGRIAICGMVASYDSEPLAMQDPQLIMLSRLSLEGFIISDHMEVWPEALRDLSGYVVHGHLTFREIVSQGLASAPGAFIGLLNGKNFGKQIVKLI